MPSTAQQYARRLGLDPYTSPHIAKFAIPAGAAFMADLRRQWSGRERSPIEAHWPAVGSYNRGLGNILSDQRECKDARLWPDIAVCTARHTTETTDYVTRIQRYWQLMESK
jgi:soluble lytic murein transglycosylase-like protein